MGPQFLPLSVAFNAKALRIHGLIRVFTVRGDFWSAVNQITTLAHTFGVIWTLGVLAKIDLLAWVKSLVIFNTVLHGQQVLFANRVDLGILFFPLSFWKS